MAGHEYNITNRIIYIRTDEHRSDKHVGAMQYRKRPVVVRAYRTNEDVIIHTLEGDMKAEAGDYIITGVKGEQYPCKPDIFQKTYEPVEEN